MEIGYEKTTIKDELSEEQLQPTNESSSTHEIHSYASDDNSNTDIHHQVDDVILSADGSIDNQPQHEHSSSLTISPSITQHVHICAAHKKPRLLLRYLEQIRKKETDDHVRHPGALLIFCTKIKTLKFVIDFLKRNSIHAEQLHGHLIQNQREKILNDFKAVRNC